MPHPSFTRVAPYYDQLMSRVPYESWVDYVEVLYRRHSGEGKRVLDLATGTGSVALALARRGYQVTGVDISVEMLEEARRKAQQADLTVEWFCQDLAKLQVPGEFDLAVCLYDSLNYITSARSLQAALQRTAAALRTSGLFIFDLNSEYSLEANLFTQSDSAANRPIRYRWQSRYDRRRRLATVDMEFETSDGQQFSEVHVQRAYGVVQIERMVIRAGMELAGVYEAYTLLPAGRFSERIYYVARRL